MSAGTWPCQHIKNTPRGWIYKHTHKGGYHACDIQDHEMFCRDCGSKRPEKPQGLAEKLLEVPWPNEKKAFCNMMAQAAYEHFSQIIDDMAKETNAAGFMISEMPSDIAASLKRYMKESL